MAKAQRITLSEEDRKQLETISRTRTLQSQVVTRARILLLKGNGESVDAIAEKDRRQKRCSMVLWIRP